MRDETTAWDASAGLTFVVRRPRGGEPRSSRPDSRRQRLGWRLAPADPVPASHAAPACPSLVRRVSTSAMNPMLRSTALGSHRRAGGSQPSPSSRKRHLGRANRLLWQRPLHPCHPCRKPDDPHLRGWVAATWTTPQPISNVACAVGRVCALDPAGSSARPERTPWKAGHGRRTAPGLRACCWRAQARRRDGEKGRQGDADPSFATGERAGMPPVLRASHRDRGWIDWDRTALTCKSVSALPTEHRNEEKPGRPGAQ